MYVIFAMVASFIFLFSLLESRLERIWISGPMLAVVLGILFGSLVRLMDFEIENESLKTLAELALALVLFTDAAHTNLTVLQHNLGLPSRLLGIGLPLTILLGILIGFAVFPDFLWVELALLATILAPTDAALGKPVVVNEKVPPQIREGLKVESGLNDGIAVPVLFLLIAVFEMNSGVGNLSFGVELFAKAIGTGIITGVAITYLADQLIHYAEKENWISASWKPMVIIALVFSIFAIAQLLEGSGFIAAFVGGILYGKINQKDKGGLLRAAEGTGDSLGLVTWFLFGMVSIGQVVSGFSWTALLYAILSLTVIRIVPVFIALLNTNHSTRERLFMGWFGPRGLASIVFLLIIMELRLPNLEPINSAICLTIILSIFAHGLSAQPLINWLTSKS